MKRFAFKRDGILSDFPCPETFLLLLLKTWGLSAVQLIFFFWQCCFVVDLRTVTVDSVLDVSFIITELYWVTDIHWHGINLETEHVLSTVKGMNWEKQKVLTDYRWRDKDYQISCSFWSFGFTFKCCFHSSTNVCLLLLLLSHNFITLAQWKLGVRASVVTANGYRFISTLIYHRSEKHRNTYMLYVLDCCAFNQSSARTQRWMICRECSDTNLKIPVSTVVLRWKTVQISVSLSRRAGLFKWPSAGSLSEI